MTGKEYHTFRKSLEGLRLQAKRIGEEAQREREILDKKQREGISDGILIAVERMEVTLTLLNE